MCDYVYVCDYIYITTLICIIDRILLLIVAAAAVSSVPLQGQWFVVYSYRSIDRWMDTLIECVNRWIDG